MKNNKSLVRFIFFTLMVLGGIFWLHQRTDHPARTTTPNSTSETSDPDKIANDGETTAVDFEPVRNPPESDPGSNNSTASRLEFSKRFITARNAAEAQAVVDEIQASGDHALAHDLELEIRGRCGFLEGMQPPYERTRWAHELILQYCSNYVDRSDGSGGLSLSITSMLAQRKLRAKLMELQTGDFDDYFMEYLGNVSSKQELRAAELIAMDLHRSGAPLSFGMTDDRLVTPDEATKALDTAFELYGCVRFGGCEQYDFRVLEYCVLTGNCESNWNMFDIYSYTLAPNVWEQVTHVLNKMLSKGNVDS